DAILLVEELDRQRCGWPEFGELLQVVIEAHRLIAPPADLQIGLDQFLQDGRTKGIAGRRKERVQINRRGVLPGSFEAVGPALELLPLVWFQFSQVGGG